MRMMVFAVLAGAALVACGPTAEDRVQPEPPQSPGAAGAPKGALGAPWPQGSSVRIAQADAGKSVAVAIGAEFAVALVGVPTAGYLWKPKSVPAFLEIVGEPTGGPTVADQNTPGYAGGSHWEVQTFRATGPGAGVLRFEQARPWETDAPPADVFEVTIVAR